MTMEPPWGPGWFLISEAPYRPRAPHQSPWDSSTGWNQPCRSRPCLIKGGCDNGCIGISLGTQWLFKINLIKSHDGLTIQISKWWYIWYVHGILVVLRGFSIHIWWGSTISGLWTDSWLHGAGGFDPAACLLFPERICFNCQLHGTFTMVHWHISKYIYISMV